MSQKDRLGAGGRINRAIPLTFTFNLMTRSGSLDFRAWLRSCKISEAEIKNILEKIVDRLDEQMEKPHAN